MQREFFISSFGLCALPLWVLAFDKLLCDASREIKKNHAGESAIIMPEQAEKGDTIRVHYIGSLESGEVFDSSEGGEPLEFEVGAGQVIEGFDEGVRSMEVGAKKRLVIEADQAYGERNDALIQQVSRVSINLDREPEVGMNFALQLPDGNQIPITVTEVTPDTITLDANHPLAGSKLIFDIELVGLDKKQA